MKNMRWLIVLFIIVVAATTKGDKLSIFKSKPWYNEKSYATYSNRDFSIRAPRYWVRDDSDWVKFEYNKPGFSLEIYDTIIGGAWIDITKSTTPMHWESPKQAAELVKGLKGLTPEMSMEYDIEQDPFYLGVLHEQDSMEIGGLPAYCTVYEYLSPYDDDTLMNFQYTVLNPDDNQLYYVNQNIYSSAAKYYPGIIDVCNNILFSLQFKRKNLVFELPESPLLSFTPN